MRLQSFLRNTNKKALLVPGGRQNAREEGKGGTECQGPMSGCGEVVGYLGLEVPQAGLGSGRVERTSRWDQAWSGTVSGAEVPLRGHPGPPPPREPMSQAVQPPLRGCVGPGADSHVSGPPPRGDSSASLQPTPSWHWEREGA